jgi:ArsR family transcriptional regulator
MIKVTEILQVLSDTTRLRLLKLLSEEELSVAELQEILEMGQSRISTHLSQIRRHGLLSDRKDGKKTFYSLLLDESPRLDLIRVALREDLEEEFWESDRAGLTRIIDRRYFDEVAERLGKNYIPGRSWDAIGHFLLRLVPQINIADLGAGEGTISQLLAERAKKVFCIDSSKSMVRLGADLAKKKNLSNLVYKQGDIEEVPLPAKSVDLALMSQSLHHAQRPEKALAEAFRILKPGGQLVVLDLKKHQFEKARELYKDQWLGFGENDLYRMIRESGFKRAKVEIVAKESKEPYFETILGVGERP